MQDLQSFLSPILYRVQNLLTILPKELQALTSDNILYIAMNGGVVLLGFYFVSKWFRAYFLRLLFFIFGAWVLWQVSARDSILQSFDFWAGLGLIIPQLEIPNLTYLIVKYRTLYIYNKIVELILILFSPFVWLYQHLTRPITYFKAKQEERADKKAYEKYYQEDFKKQQKQEQYQKYEEQKKQYKQQEEKKTYSRWDSKNYYEVLGIDETASKKEIKKAYYKLIKIYHPDLALQNKDKAEEIMKKINNAYDILG